MEPIIDKRGILKRVYSVINSRDHLMKISKNIGVNTPWIKAQHKKPLILGPAEQANPFFSTYAYSRDINISPENLQKEIQKEKEIVSELNNSGINSRISLLTLKYDSFTSTGPTSICHFLGKNGNRGNFIGSKKIRKFSGTPFCDVVIERYGILNGLEETIRSFDKDEICQESLSLLYDDVNTSLDNSFIDRKYVNYFNFCNSFNQKTLTMLCGYKLPIEYIDAGRLDTFAISGVDSWDTFLNFMLENDFLKSADALFRFSVKTPKGNKFVRLGLRNSPSLRNRRISSNPLVLNNYDYKSRGWGEEFYRMEDLQKFSNMKKGSDSKLVVASNLEYFLLLSGMTNIFMGDDGIPSPKINSVVKGLDLLGVPVSFFGYCPHNRKEKGIKNVDYLPSCNASILDFYKFANGNKK